MAAIVGLLSNMHLLSEVSAFLSFQVAERINALLGPVQGLVSCGVEVSMVLLAEGYGMFISWLQAHASDSVACPEVMGNARWVDAADQAGLLPGPSQMFL